MTSDIVVTMLANDEASTPVHGGANGLFAAQGGAGHFVEMGTLSPRHVLELAAQADGRSVIDAPVSGSIDAAREAQLMIMVGADDETLDPIRPVLSAMGKE